MDTISNHSIKVNRAIGMCALSNYPQSASAMLAEIPQDVIATLPARLIAKMIDANWNLAQKSKDIATRDAVEEGVIWDNRCQKLREIAQ